MKNLNRLFEEILKESKKTMSYSDLCKLRDEDYEDTMIVDSYFDDQIDWDNAVQLLIEFGRSKEEAEEHLSTCSYDQKVDDEESEYYDSF